MPKQPTEGSMQTILHCVGCTFYLLGEARD